MNGNTSDLREPLGKTYSQALLKPPAWIDPADASYLGKHLIERSIAYLAPRLNGELIDVGCGEQPYRRYFKHIKRIVACDFDAQRGNVDFACPAHNIPCAAESFDSVLCTEVLEHVSDPLAVWREFFRILKPRGQVLLTTPMYWPPHELPYDFFRYPEHGLRYLATTAGFGVLELVPRGGRWALLGQVGIQVMSRQMKLRFVRRVWNEFFLWADRKRLTPDVTIGWTILAQKLPTRDFSGSPITGNAIQSEMR